jgi:hypothetical protein
MSALQEFQWTWQAVGCGTLILIALIVLFYSRPGVTDRERDVRSEVSDLKQAVESQTK